MQHISRGACRGRHHASAQRGRARSVRNGEGEGGEGQANAAAIVVWRNGEGEGGEGQANAAAIVVWNALWWFEEITQPKVRAGADTVPLYYQTYNCATPGLRLASLQHPCHAGAPKVGVSGGQVRRGSDM